MRGVFASIGRRGGFVPSLLALILLSRLLIPSGYMIAPDQEGRPGLAPCAAAAPAGADGHGGHDGHGTDPAPSKPGEQPCPFAAAAAPPLLPAPPAVTPQAHAAVIPPGLPAGANLIRVAPAAPPPPATGPPPTV